MNFLKIFLTFLFASIMLDARQSYAQSDVHFGTIFVEDINYQNADDNEKINYLTDQSKKQQQLETLYKKEIGEPNKEIKKFDVTPRKPAATVQKSSTPAKKVGVIRNDEIPQKIIYFVELRSFDGNKAIQLRRGANINAPTMMTLAPGEFLKIEDTPDQYIHKMRMDRDNQGIWKKAKTREEDVQTPYFYYDWRNFLTITSHDFPVEIDILVPYGKNTIPVFSKPGSWTWRDCGLNEDLCLDNIDLHTKAYLFDVTLIEKNTSNTNNPQYKLFYKIGYQVKSKDGSIQHKIGWVPSTHAKRKISQLPKSLLATRGPNSFTTYESDEERYARLSKYYIFKDNMYSNNKNMTRWINSTPGQDSEVFFQNIAFDGVAHFNSFHLEQSFLDEEFDQIGVAVGIGMFAPIFIDLELQGTFMFTVPLSANEGDVFEKSYLFRGDQWLLYTTPFSLGGNAFKFGVGGYYMTMFSSSKEYGFNSLLGFQGKALLEDPAYWFGVRYGPTGQDLNFKFENREIGAEFGIRLNPEKSFESWSIYGDFSDTSYKSTNSENSTKFQLISIGVRKQF